MENISTEKQIELLEQNLHKVKGKFTLADASAITGVPIEYARELLNALMSKYICHLQVTENGDLIYDFGTSPTRRDAKTFAEHFKDFQNFLWKAFKVFFKAWIAVTLVVYFVIFLLILLAIIIGSLSGGKDSKRSSKGDGALFRLIGNIFYAIFRWQTIQNATYYEKDRYGYPYKTYKPQEFSLFPKKDNNPKSQKNFISAVYDFVFGPPRVEPEPLANQKEAAAYARKNKGVMVLSEFKALTGLKNEEAENLMTDCIARYNGSAEISPNAVLYADFYELTRSKIQTEDAPIIFYWDEYEPEYVLTGNTAGKNTWIAFMNSFNLLFALLMLGGYEDWSNDMGVSPDVIYYGLGVVPLAFSIIFFAVPIFRYFVLIPKRKQRHKNNIRKRIAKVIYQIGSKRDLNINEILAEVNKAEGLEKLSKVQVEKIMNEMIIDWGGEVNVQSDDTLIYSFSQMKTELQEIQQIRLKRVDEGLGKIYFDTNN
ncbi:hypothetical protein [Raineya orbicola]|jgi:hypothetical protein|uniref:Uncharacterized protein n=1 Tax=Raineya orbicola TaxID=2016530 RepID=A0A2N3I9S0_9BACT|nr:hypothetical protein [Raineya orbicola]PKQ67030.1 hypothetical protein Rain11_2193 [Raineya orbicola]